MGWLSRYVQVEYGPMELDLNLRVAHLWLITSWLMGLLMISWLTGWVRRYVQVEYGPMELDLNLRVRIYELEKHLKQQVSAHCVWSTYEAVLTWYVSSGTCLGMGDAFPMQHSRSRVVYSAVNRVLQCCVTIAKNCNSEVWQMDNALLQLC